MNGMVDGPRLGNLLRKRWPAPFGSHAVNLAAITASICAGPESHADSRRRFVAGISCGIFYLLFGAFSTAVVALFAVIPAAMLTVLAGVALLGALQGAIQDTVTGDGSGPALRGCADHPCGHGVGHCSLGIVSPFWGCLAGAVAYFAGRRRTRA
ncbi:benzoate/H(+) symporter BenE family transporter [Pseudarthrobacter sp. H2]|uniref:benzoate/H(+) symporter BenE family transporter n=1 Tax=Pseudarthrobacter sp. H2 TaxID=3418415 RepID=UPI003CEA9B4E